MIKNIRNIPIYFQLSCILFSYPSIIKYNFPLYLRFLFLIQGIVSYSNEVLTYHRILWIKCIDFLNALSITLIFLKKYRKNVNFYIFIPLVTIFLTLRLISRIIYLEEFPELTKKYYIIQSIWHYYTILSLYYLIKKIY